MSDNIPFDIQMQIIKKVSDVKSLIQFRSVSKPWKSFIDSSEFINGYDARHTQPHSHILSYKSDHTSDAKYICVVDDDNNETFKVTQQELAPFVMSPLLKQYSFSYAVGACHGLLCLFCYNKGCFKGKRMLVIWNPSIGKSFGIDVLSHDPQLKNAYGFGVCPVTSDPTVVKILRSYETPLHVEVFTLSSGVWSVLPSSNLPHESIGLLTSHVAIDRFIYWGSCCDVTSNNAKSIVLSFDLITKELKVVDLPDSLTKDLLGALPVSVSKLRGSLVVSGFVKGEHFFGLWVMEHDSSFTKLFSFGTQYSILGFRKNGEAIFETRMEDDQFTKLEVYNPHSQQIKNLGITGVVYSFFMDSYKQSLLLLDHSDSHIYSDDN